MAIRVPTDPDVFFSEFIPEMYTQATARNKIPAVPYTVSVDLEGGSRYSFHWDGSQLDQQSGDNAPKGDIRVSLTPEDFKELARFARSQAVDEPPEAPPIPPTYQFPAIDTLRGVLQFVLDDLGDKRHVRVAFGDVADDADPTATIHTTLDFVAELQGKAIAVDQLLRAAGVRIDGDFGYVLRLANAMTGKTRRRER